ncbi:hypothetical protein MAB47J26_04990 [Mycobacteroides abscessus 47J26]|nr:hypothetical protein MAB47J26_04990 [Mycobacteroides abscessus 47J26]
MVHNSAMWCKQLVWLSKLSLNCIDRGARYWD